MGLISHILFWPVTGPVAGVRWSLDKVRSAVEQELTDDTPVKEELMALQMGLELGEIDDDEYLAREAELMQRLRDVRAWREEFGMGTSGGPVRVARDSKPEVLDPSASDVVITLQGDDASGEPDER